ncbi:MAG TPA: SEC-C metal-binding domain-containing protein [Chthoniobacterales bacterium]
MVQLVQNNFISPEAQALIAKKAYYHDGLRELAALLPADDAELHQWLSAAADALDTAAFQMLISAAAMDERKLQTSLLPTALLMQMGAWNVGWLAWHMEGNVTEDLLNALELVTVLKDEVKAVALFVAAAWWMEHRKTENLPPRIERLMSQLTEKGTELDLRAQIVLVDLALLTGGPDVAALYANKTARANAGLLRKQLARAFALLKGPYKNFIFERETHRYQGSQPKRRAVEDVGRNERCHCGSGKKYKKCCQKKDEERLRNSSSVAGVTKAELAADSDAPLTEAHLDAMSATDFLHLSADRVPIELQARFVLSLVILKHYEEAIAALRKFGVGEHLRSVWSVLFEHASDSWRPDFARELMEVFPDAEEKLGEKAHAGIRFLLVGDDPARAFQELEKSVEALLKSGDLEELQKLTWVLLESPYRGLGVLLARSVLPIVDEKYVEGLFDGIIGARAKMNLSPDDEFSDWMDERTLRAAQQHETAATQEAQDKLEAKMEELRAAKEAKARAERELALRDQREHRRSEEKKAESPSHQERERERELKAEIKRSNALVTQYGGEKVQLRRELEKRNQEIEALKREAVETKTPENDDDDEGENFVAEGNQPVRLMDFPAGFAETLAGFPRHVGRATMNRLGRLASGEPGAFERLKNLKAYSGVLRARVSDKYRLLFCLQPDRIRVVDLVRRTDLEWRIERLQASGLPPIE